ncbi:GNAT family N-acetyltransferase [Chryseolinea soli]|uniref:Arginyl-tRNA--protein arginylyltransferase n=1 Tax=Chryseolinea soli TaxID=2321403 RepID=A0A385SGL3_9BACT|nr:GNAT family N-acetyltransferase [Chryseolinea soli]AYB29601.1 arginyl-tRNA--protein arginylyltransferase [Chryseolinea soli]
MFAQVEHPDHLDPQALDAYLARGWFRMGQTIFTTNFLHFSDQMYSAIWLRVALDDFGKDSAQAKLFKQNKNFQTRIQPAVLTSEHEALYHRYRQPLAFEPSASLGQLLFGKRAVNTIYNTYEITVHDGEKLIAVGFFDLGLHSAMGITSVYDPEYKKYSLGKYLIYRKMDFCKMQGLRYFYPGYFVPGYAYFDYKLTIGRTALQFLKLTTQQWVPIAQFNDDDVPYQVMFNKLESLKALLPAGQILKYEYFDANLVPDLKDFELFDFPLLLQYSDPSENGILQTVTFDVRDGEFHMLLCSPAFTPKEPTSDPDFYSRHLLLVEQELFSTPSPHDMAEVILKFVRPLS